MKKFLIIFVLLALLATFSMAYTIGICAQNWTGHICNTKVHGVYVSKTCEGYVAHGVLAKGDVITEALVFPAYRCLGRCCPLDNCSNCYDPCNPCDPCNTYSPRSYSFSACCTLESQLSQFCGVRYCHKYTRNKFSLGDALDCLNPGQTVVMRIYRTTTCQWFLGILSWDGTCPQLALYPCVQPCAQPCVQPCNPCSTSPCITSIKVMVESNCFTQPYTVEIMVH